MTRKTSRFRWWLLPLPLIGLLVLAEIVLRLAWQPPLLYESNFLLRPFYIAETQDETSTTYVTHSAKPEEIFGQSGVPPKPMDPRQISPARIRVPKKPGTVRVFLVGSSPIYGGPGLTRFSLSTYVGKYLAVARPAVEFEIIEAAAQQMSADTLGEIIEELAVLQPDFTLVYVGGAVPTLEAPGSHETADAAPILFKVANAIGRLYLVQVLGPSAQRSLKDAVLTVDNFLSPGDRHDNEINMQKNMLEEARRKMEDVYREMAVAAKRLPGQTAFYEVVTDLAGSPLIWSLSFKKLDPEQSKRFFSSLKEANEALANGQSTRAEAAARQALAIDDTYAEAHFVHGRALLELRRTEESYNAYDRARESDASHDRLFSAPRRQLAKALNENHLPLLPSDEAFRRNAEQGVPGPDLFRDITHPTPLGLAVLGHLGAAWILEHLPAPAGQTTPVLPSPHEIGRASCRERVFITV